MKVKKLNIVESGPRDNLIQWLEELTEQAKSGELQGMAVACEWKSGGVGEGWVLTGNQNYRILGCLDVLRHKIIAMVS